MSLKATTKPIRAVHSQPKLFCDHIATLGCRMTVDPEDVMTIGNRLLDHHTGTFSDEFDRNQKAVRDLTDVQSIHLRNRIAGYITRQQQQSPSSESV